MSEIRVNDIVAANGGDAVGFSKGINVTGVATAVKFSGDVLGVGITATTFTGALTGNATGLSGTPDITVDGVTANDIKVSGSCTITGNLTVDGTQTIVNTSTLDVADKTVGIASTTNATNSSADGAGIEIYASHSTLNNNKTISWDLDNTSFNYSDPNKVKGVYESVAAAATHTDSSGNVVLELDLRNATTFTYSTPANSATGKGANIGVVSFKNVPTDAANFTTATVLFTQGASAAGTGNTLPTNGLGTTCTVSAMNSSTGTTLLVGVSTRGWQGGGTGAASTVTLSTTVGDYDFVSFGIHYTGGTNTDLKSYKIYVTKNGGFTQGNVGI
tara:strand:+ start:137 stop:1129 length:993 start_codon:yes stop_codon:yes gene_type:complete